MGSCCTKENTQAQHLVNEVPPLDADHDTEQQATFLKNVDLPHKVDERHRGKISEDEAKEVLQQAQCFYGDEYSNVFAALNEVHVAELGPAMVSFSQLCYKIARNVLIKKITEQFDTLFCYHENPTDEEYAALADIQKAYGLLLYHHKASKNANLEMIIKLVSDEVEQSLNKDTENKCKSLIDEMERAGPHQESVKEFYKHSIEQAVQMASISPPMVIHTQDLFDKRMAHEAEQTINPPPPLLWTRPVLMENWSGNVIEKGKAGNRKKMLQDSSTD